MYAAVRLSVLLSAVALCVATPYYLAQAQQRQLFYPVVQQYSQYSAPVAPATVPYRQVYYAPQTAANLVAPVPSALRYQYPVAAPAKQVLFYPGGNPYSGNYILAGDEQSESSGGWTSWLSNLPFASFITGATQPAAPESPASESEAASPANPEKVQASNSEEPSKEDDKKEEGVKKPAENVKVAAPQRYVVLAQPQFYGNYGLQRVNPAAVLPSANNGAVSSFLLLKNFPGVRFAPDAPQVPQAADDAELIPAGQPGSAALGYQRILQAAQEQASRQQKEYDDSASVVVDAAATRDKPASETEADQNDDEEPGPTIAQAKPKAIALAGPGGVAAAAPMGTALVGPGGMAISAPEATAVAGAKGNAGGAVSPATAKQASKAIRTYQLANTNFSYLFNL